MLRQLFKNLADGFFKRLADKHVNTFFQIAAPASLRKYSCMDTVYVEGSFFKNEWTVKLAKDVHVSSDIFPTTYPPIIDPSGPLKSPQGNKTFTNDEIVTFVRDTCRQVQEYSPRMQESKIAQFEKIAKACGWTEPALPRSAAAVANPRKTLG